MQTLVDKMLLDDERFFRAGAESHYRRVVLLKRLDRILSHPDEHVVFASFLDRLNSVVLDWQALQSHMVLISFYHSRHIAGTLNKGVYVGENNNNQRRHRIAQARAAIPAGAGRR